MHQQFEILEMQKTTLKHKFLSTEQSIQKLEREIKHQQDSLENSQNEVSSLLLSKQVMFYDQKMSLLKESFLLGEKNEENFNKATEEEAQRLIADFRDKIMQTRSEKEQLLKLESMMLDQINLMKIGEENKKPQDRL